MTDDPPPAEALAAIREARGAVGRDLRHGLGYELLYGLVCGLLVAGQGLPQPWAVLTVPIALGGLALMVRGWRARYGFWVDGFAPRRARWVALTTGAALALLMIASLAGRAMDMAWIPLVTGPVAFVVAIVCGRWWMAVYRRELQETL